MQPPFTPAPAAVQSGAVRSCLAHLEADCRQLSHLAERLAPPARRGLLQLIEAIGTRLDALAAKGAAGPADDELTRQEMESIQAELAIVRATLEGRVGSLQKRAHRIHRTKETRNMARKPWLFDPENLAELDLLATADNSVLAAVEREGDDSWTDWDDWSDANTDDEPGVDLRELHDEAPTRDWKGHSRSHGHRRHRSHRRL